MCVRTKQHRGTNLSELGATSRATNLYRATNQYLLNPSLIVCMYVGMYVHVSLYLFFIFLDLFTILVEILLGTPPPFFPREARRCFDMVRRAGVSEFLFFFCFFHFFCSLCRCEFVRPTLSALLTWTSANTRSPAIVRARYSHTQYYKYYTYLPPSPPSPPPTKTHMKPVVIETMWQGKAAGRVLLSFSRRPLFQALFPGAAEAAQSQQQSQQQQQQRSSTTLVSLLVA